MSAIYHSIKLPFDEEVVEKILNVIQYVFNLLQVPWFCGHFRRCWDPPGNRWALEQAKFNLANKYFLVGLTEDLETFIDLMEMSLPRFFKVQFFILFQVSFFNFLGPNGPEGSLQPVWVWFVQNLYASKNSSNEFLCHKKSSLPSVF